MELVKPSMQYEQTFHDALQEMGGVKAGVADWEQIGFPENIQEYIRIRHDHSLGRNLPEGWIPATTYWLIENETFIGEVSVRHQLTEHLRHVGGQIGYWIRPSKRQQGHGRKILRLALDKAKELDLKKIVITCDETNDASRKIIEANGGVFEQKHDMGPGLPQKLIFWIDIH